MEHAGKHSDAPASPDAWEEARQYGVDMTGLLANLNRTVLERIRNHDRALTLALALREAMADRYGQLRKPSGTPD
jgi:hypothetical protein